MTAKTKPHARELSLKEAIELPTLLNTLQQKQFQECATKLLENLNQLCRTNIVMISKEDQKHLELFAKLILMTFTTPEFHIPLHQQIPFTQHATLISNLVSNTSFKNTDIALTALLEQQAEYSKILPLYTPSNTIRINLTEASEKLPLHTSKWLAEILTRFHSRCNEQTEKHRDEILNNTNLQKNYTVIEKAPNDEIIYNTTPYFYLTYFDHPQERNFKQTLHSKLQKKFPLNIANTKPDMQKLAVVTEFGYKAHAVYKSIFPLIYGLKDQYHLTLLQLEKEHHPGENFDTELFDETISIGENRHGLEEIIEVYEREQYGITLFPDIGMSPASMILSNLRLSPIQITTPGHPVSTYGSKIDYFISGTETEIADKAKENYSERLILIPGAGASPFIPDYTPQKPELNSDTITISLAWGTHKTHYPYAVLFKKILEKASRPVKLRFATLYSNDLSFQPMVQDLIALFGGEHIEATSVMDYTPYMHNIETCHFGVDSYPFGGYNRIIDTLVCQRPIIARQGDKLYNRLNTYILKQVGLEELIADSDEALINLTLKLIEDETYRTQLTDHVKSINLKEKLENPNDAKYFKQAMDYLKEHHNTLKKEKEKAPIFIQETQA